ncbi:hypothetical protein L6164_018927 [Bauhinia variegata]|uniref:Uncharacterized protein n=1 Tax=Bauhinia variegata TaxID=167791 RepID=A0ACB9NE04_BAUVA|nr:hypothetical protein L6164_018927 [Bauhinia variegata]
MDTEKNSEAKAARMPESKGKDKGKAVDWADPPVVFTKATPVPLPGQRWKKGVAIADFVLRLGAIGAAMGSAANMGTNEEQLPFFTQFLQFHAQWNVFPMFQFFVVANGVVSGYVVLSLPFSLVCIFRPQAVAPRFLLVTLDMVMMALVTAAAASSAAIVYLAHNGSQDANWMAICQQYTQFCSNASQAVVTSFLAATFLTCLIFLSTLALKRNRE